tara:strand:+ start:94 stop:726 length:633 start_codon:yes stop_codon:yes gene_type:complete
MKKLLGIVVLNLLWCNTAFALPKCQGEDISKWTICEGVKTTSKGSKYTGEFKNGKYHGQGSITNVAGDKYVGGWKDGKFYGKGTLVYSNGDTKSGNWKDGKFNKQIALTPSNNDKKKEEKIPENISKSMIMNVINKITKGDGMKNIDLKDAMKQLKSSGIDIDMDPEQLKKYLNSKEFTKILNSKDVQNKLNSKEFLEKIKKEFETIKNR